MSTKTICDRCKNEIKDGDKVRIEVWQDGVPVFKDFHIDCFNYQFSCDVRKIKEV